jgi:hypothetical protein
MEVRIINGILTRSPRVNREKNGGGGGGLRKRPKQINPETDLKLWKKYLRMRRFSVIPNVTI